MGLERVKLGEHTHYFPGGTNVGLFTSGSTDAYLIDSGNDKEAGRRLLSSINSTGLTLKAILNTHSNADHCGGNQFLQERTSCRVISTEIEAAFLKHPVLEPSLLYGGMPPQELMSKFFMAKPSLVEPDSMKLLPEGITAIDLPGHYFGMCGFITEDKVFFCADSLFSKNVLDKYHISFIHDIAAYLATLKILPEVECDVFVPSHAEPTSDISPLAAINREKVLEIADIILELCRIPSGPEQILKGLYDRYGLCLDIGQHALAGSTVKSYLTYLCGLGRLDRSFEGNLLAYSRT